MKGKVSIIGVYPIQNKADVHFIELEIDEKPSLVDIGVFTQETPDRPRQDWQAAYDEHYLNSSGDDIIGDSMNLPEEDDAPTRLAFFLYFVNFDLPLLSQFGESKLPCATELPERLKDIIVFEDVD